MLYRHYDRSGVLLYIGSSNVHKFSSRQDDRVDEHRRNLVTITREELARLQRVAGEGPAVYP